MCEAERAPNGFAGLKSVASSKSEQEEASGPERGLCASLPPRSFAISFRLAQVGAGIGILLGAPISSETDARGR